MVAQLTVNQCVAGSNPAGGAIKCNKTSPFRAGLFLLCILLDDCNHSVRKIRLSSKWVMLMATVIDLIVNHSFIVYFITDILAVYLSDKYVKRRQRLFSCKTYNPRTYIVIVLIITVVQQLYASKNYSYSVQELGITASLLLIYLSIALIDLRIRIVGNDFVVLLLVITCLWRIWIYGPYAQLSYLSFAFIVYCVLSATITFTSKVLHIDSAIGMGDIKLLCATAFLLGINRFGSMVFLMLIYLFLFIILQVMQRKFQAQQTIAFAPFISLATLSILLLNI